MSKDKDLGVKKLPNGRYLVEGQEFKSSGRLIDGELLLVPVDVDIKDLEFTDKTIYDKKRDFKLVSEEEGSTVHPQYILDSEKDLKEVDGIVEVDGVKYKNSGLLIEGAPLLIEINKDPKDIEFTDKMIYDKELGLYIVSEREESHISGSLLDPEDLKIEIPESSTEDKPKVGRYNKAGHLVDQILKYDYPKDKKNNKTIQPELFDLWEDNKKEVERLMESKDIELEAGYSKIEGLNNLSAPELKIVDCLCLLLHKKSQISDPTAPDYYTGDKGYEVEPYNFKVNNELVKSSTPAPNLSLTYYELAKIYYGGEVKGGRDLNDLRLSLLDLSDKKFLINYSEKVKDKKSGEYNKIEIQTIRPLIYVDRYVLSKGVNDIEESKKTTFIITLHPIFRRQIDSKFISYPEDITKRTMLAYGSSNISDITIKLREDLMREKSQKVYTYKIYQSKLFYKVAEKYMRQSRKKLVKRYLDKSIETVKKLGLLQSLEIITGSTGEPLYIFNINKDF